MNTIILATVLLATLAIYCNAQPMDETQLDNEFKRLALRGLLEELSEGYELDLDTRGRHGSGSGRHHGRHRGSGSGRHRHRHGGSGSGAPPPPPEGSGSGSGGQRRSMAFDDSDDLD